MTLFPILPSDLRNLLPEDGEAYYYGPILEELVADNFYAALWNNIEWRYDEAILFGKKIQTKRKVAWYGREPFSYTYSKTTKKALPWTDDLLKLKSICEKQTQETFNSCLLNLYHTGAEGMAWHSDAENELKKNGAIASLSLGAERKFAFKHKATKKSTSVMLEHGGLLVMQGETQSNWLHRLPPTTQTSTPRINLTFRTVAKT